MFLVCNNGCIKYEEIESHPDTVSNIKPFINKYKWKINKLDK